MKKSTMYTLTALIVAVIAINLLNASYISEKGAVVPTLGWFNLFGGVFLLGVAWGIYNERKVEK